MTVHTPRFVFIALCVTAMLLATRTHALRAPADSRTADNRQQESDQVVWDANTVLLESQEIGPGVYAVIPTEAHDKVPQGRPAATSGGFVVGERGVLVVDTMLNARLAGQVIGLIREVTDLPIRYIINTSYHGDHCYGNFVFPKTACVIQHPATREYVAEHFDEDRAFMLQYFGRGRGIEEVIPRDADLLVEDNLTIDLGGISVEIRHFGFAQTDGDLFVYVPECEVLFTGNALIAKAPALPWLLDGRHRESLATMRAVQESLSANATVVPGHGLPLTRDDMTFSIEYLSTLDREVAAAIKEGLTLEQTVERTGTEMSDFKGYALWDWVHAQVNVPAAYRALSEEKSDR